ncbi:hypothetical protein ZIOFF_006110 [Zingiber officinale]|uniref:Cysteine proteinase inhibitor n=1 Tax=Zingiber officinale TaxID=94328 RepID=A0A8J5LN37_ZINOF|nr:hypothetical protein ZIOFF_006110 [Zingiber officinale]
MLRRKEIPCRREGSGDLCSQSGRTCLCLRARNEGGNLCLRVTWEGRAAAACTHDWERDASTHAQGKKNALLEFAHVVKAREQVVAGTLHHLTVEAVEGGEKKLYEPKVWVKTWLNFKQVEEFKHVGEQEMLKATGQFKEPSLHAAVMLEQASYCYLLFIPPMLRKYGFHLVLSGNHYYISDQFTNLKYSRVEIDEV